MKKVRFSTHSSKQKRRWVVMGMAVVSVGLANPCGIHDAIEELSKNDIEAERISIAGSTKNTTTKELSLLQSESFHKDFATPPPLSKKNFNPVKATKSKINAREVIRRIFRSNKVQKKSPEIAEQSKEKESETELFLAKAASEFQLHKGTKLDQRSIVTFKPCLTDSLGEGRNGDVYSEEIEGEKIAMKMFKKNDNWKHELRLQLSGAGGCSLKHKNVVSMLCTATSGSHLWIAFPLYKSGSALKYLESKQKQLTKEEILIFARDVASGLEYLHRNGIGHFDIKPANILISNEEFGFKISDFGLSKHVKTHPFHFVDRGLRGTPCYMAPEIYEKGSLGQGLPADIYSYGISVYHMASGEQPFKCFKTLSELQTAKTGGFSLPPLERISTLNSLVQNCTKLSPTERPKAMDIPEVLNDITDTISEN